MSTATCVAFEIAAPDARLIRLILKHSPPPEEGWSAEVEVRAAPRGLKIASIGRASVRLDPENFEDAAKIARDGLAVAQQAQTVAAAGVVVAAERGSTTRRAAHRAVMDIFRVH